MGVVVEKTPPEPEPVVIIQSQDMTLEEKVAAARQLLEDRKAAEEEARKVMLQAQANLKVLKDDYDAACEQGAKEDNATVAIQASIRRKAAKKQVEEKRQQK